jgi:hypothetical protein
MADSYESYYRAACNQGYSQQQAMAYARNAADIQARVEHSERASSGDMTVMSLDRYGRRRDAYLPSRTVDSRVRAVREFHAALEHERTREMGQGDRSSYTSASRHEERETQRQEDVARRAEGISRRGAEVYGTSDYGAPVRRRGSVSGDHGHGSSKTVRGRSGHDGYHGNPAGLGYVVRPTEPSRPRASDPFEYDEWEDQEYGFDSFGRHR